MYLGVRTDEQDEVSNGRVVRTISEILAKQNADQMLTRQNQPANPIENPAENEVTHEDNQPQELVEDANEGSRPTASRSPNLFASLNGSDKSISLLSENDQPIGQNINNQGTADSTPDGLQPVLTQNLQPTNIEGKISDLISHIVSLI